MMPEAIPVDLPTLAAALTPAAVAIAAVWRYLTSRLNHCETQHDAANKELQSMAERVGHLEGRIAGYQEAKGDMQMAGKMLGRQECSTRAVTVAQLPATPAGARPAEPPRHD